MEKCNECGGNSSHLFRPCGNPDAPEMCSQCVLDYEESMREQDELDYLQAEYW